MNRTTPLLRNSGFLDPKIDIEKQFLDTLLVLCIEAEPLDYADRYIAATFPRQVIHALEYLAETLSVENLVVASNEKSQDSLRSLCSKTKGTFTFISVERSYPSGDLIHLAGRATGRKSSVSGVLPLRASTLYLLSHCLSENIPVTRTIVTVIVDRKMTRIVSVPIGTPIRILMQQLGCQPDREKAIIIGGSLRGRSIVDFAEPIDRDTRVVLVLPDNHPLVLENGLDRDHHIGRIRSACSQCLRCSEYCPRRRQGFPLAPHLTIRSLDPNDDIEKHPILSVFHCNDCGLCRLVCPADLSPQMLHRMLRQAFLDRQLYAGSESGDGPLADPPLLPLPWADVLRRTGLSGYDDLSILGGELFSIDTDLVSLPLNRMPFETYARFVTSGDSIAIGDPVAVNEKTHISLHASIGGIVVAAKPDSIMIKGVR